MAMLAEPRRKQKLSNDPRNLTWSNDDSKFGQKMLEKMGWSKGKGLGASEQGRVENIKISMKNDTTGVGCTKKYGDNWLAHQDDFNALLATLSTNHNGSGTNTPEPCDKVNSLEESSKTAKGRVHYGKFTRGKDLSLRNKEELSCIFGKKKSVKKNEKEFATNKDSADSGEDSDTEKDGKKAMTFVSTQSVGDYFGQKMAALRKARSIGADSSNTVNSTPSSTAPNSSDSTGEDKSTVSSELLEEKSDQHKTSVHSEEQIVRKKKKKCKKKDKSADTLVVSCADVSHSADVVCAESNSANDTAEVKEKVVKMKKKNKRKDRPDKVDVNSVDETDQALPDTVSADSNFAIDTSEFEEKVMKKKKKSKKKNNLLKSKCELNDVSSGNVVESNDDEPRSDAISQDSGDVKETKKSGKMCNNKRKLETEKDCVAAAVKLCKLRENIFSSDGASLSKNKKRKMSETRLSKSNGVEVTESVQRVNGSAKVMDSGIGRKYVLDKKRKKKIFVDDLQAPNILQE